MDIAGAISAVTAAIGFARELNNVNIQVDQATLKLKVAELTTALADAKLGLVDVAELLRDKEQEIARLTGLLAYKASNLVDVDGMRYRTQDGQPVGLPICPVCEAKGLFITLAQDRSTNGYPYRCPSCKANYGHQARYKSPTAKTDQPA